MVRRVVARVVDRRRGGSLPASESGAGRATLLAPPSAPAPPCGVGGSVADDRARIVVDGAEIVALDRGSEFPVAADAVWTPLARDLARERGIVVKPIAPSEAASTVALGADHGGFGLKRALLAWLRGRGVRVVDVGTDSEAPCDYPDFALAAARAVARGQARFAIAIDGAGIGSSMVGNRVPGVLAALCCSPDAARNAREHNGANMLTLGAKGLTEGEAERIVDVFLTTPHTGDRHKRRVAKILALDRGRVHL